MQIKWIRLLFCVIPLTSALLFGCTGAEPNAGNMAIEYEAEQKTSMTPLNSENLPPSRLGNITIYNDSKRADLQLGMPLDEVKAVLQSIGYDKNSASYITWRSHGSQFITYDDFSLQTLAYDDNGTQKDYLAWIYIKSSDYQTNKGLKPGSNWSDVLEAYGQADHEQGGQDHGYLSPCWIQEPFAYETSLHDWARDDYYFFAVENDSHMSGYGIALESLPKQQETYQRDKSKGAILYENKIAGFSVELPGSWSGYFRSSDDENGSYFFYERKTSDGYYADMFSINNGDGDMEDSIIQAGTAHRKQFISSTSTDDSLSILSGWDLEKGRNMMYDRQNIIATFKEIPIDPQDTSHTRDWLDEARQARSMAVIQPPRWLFAAMNAASKNYMKRKQ